MTNSATQISAYTTFTSFAALFDRPDEQLHQRPPTGNEAEQARQIARDAAAVVLGRQKNYQPLYRLDEGGGGREAVLRHSVDLLRREFAHVLRKSQVRVLDVGCNAGFVSLSLAETFPNTVGFDINPDNIALCRALARHSGSPAQFFQADFQQVAQRPDAGLEQLDAVLLLNVVHQMIFANGLVAAKALLGRLAQSVDLLVVELARPREYRRHGKDHLLPLDPAEVLEECRDATITLIKDQPRPLYTVRRRALTVEGASVPYSRVDFSRHNLARVSRKYYYGSNTFTKVIRYTSLRAAPRFKAEVASLKALIGQKAAPAFLASDHGGAMGRVVMRRLYGESLNKVLPEFSARQRARALREVIRLCAALALQGRVQNDLSGHNFLQLSDGSLRMIDFETATPEVRRDPFASLLWIARNLEAGELHSYREVKPGDLAVKKGSGSERVAPEFYPALSGPALAAAFGSDLAAILEEARHTEKPWLDFIITAAWDRVKDCPDPVPAQPEGAAP